MTHTPIWQSIATALREEIARGDHAPGDKLPTEAALSARFGVNRHTIRHALATLNEESLTHSRRGSGVFVTAQPTPYKLGRRVRFHQNIAASGQTGSKRILNLTTRTCDASEAKALALSPRAEVHVAEGISSANDLPLAVFVSVFPAKPFPNLPEALQRTHSVTASLKEAGIKDYTRASTQLTAEPATPLQALHLRISERAPVLCAVSINIAPDGTPVEYGKTWFAGERVLLQIDPE